MTKALLLTACFLTGAFADKISTEAQFDEQGGGRIISKYAHTFKSVSTEKLKLYSVTAIVFRNDGSVAKLDGSPRDIGTYSIFRTNFIFGAKYKVNPYVTPYTKLMIAAMWIDFDKWNNGPKANIYGDKANFRYIFTPGMGGLIYKNANHSFNYYAELNFGGHKEGGFKSTDLDLHEAIISAQYSYKINDDFLAYLRLEEFYDIIDNGQASYDDHELRTIVGATYSF